MQHRPKWNKRLNLVTFLFFSELPGNVTVSPFSGTYPMDNVSYYFNSSDNITHSWYTESFILEKGSQFIVKAPGSFLLSAVAASMADTVDISGNQTTDGSARGELNWRGGDVVLLGPVATSCNFDNIVLHKRPNALNDSVNLQFDSNTDKQYYWLTTNPFQCSEKDFLQLFLVSLSIKQK
jgi:hypothetical protein